jgi:hypothetical protein
MTKKHEDFVRAGKISAQKRFEKWGRYAQIETNRKGAQTMNCNRWHIGRGIFNPTCVICLGDLLKEQLSMFQKYEV